LLPPEFPFAADFLGREWPLLLAACSIPRNPANIATLASAVRESNSLIRLAEQHRVLAQLAAALAGVPGAQMPSGLLDAIRSRQRAQLLFNLAITAELFRILELLRKSELEVVVVKGPILSLRAYNDPSARRYVDLDLLVRHADVCRGVENLIAAGYESNVLLQAVRDGKIPGEYFFRRPGTEIIFELHTERSFRYFPKTLPIENYLGQKVLLTLDGHAVPALSPENEFVLISIHGAKHFWERLICISDVAAMVHNHPELDWNMIRRSAAEAGAERMVRVALLLAERSLGVAIPQEMKNEVQRDSACLRLVRQIETWLPYAGFAAPSIVPRAFFRFAIRGNAIAGLGYLVRLSLSTTEEDWSPENATPRLRWAEILRRPFRLAKKYRRGP
jgi:Uncharacterised nucleotidyltransferase